MSDPLDDQIKEYLGENRPVPPELVRRAKELMPETGPSANCPHCGKRITPFKKPPQAQKWNVLWLLAGAAAFILSFAFARYFLQFLAVALFCGFKWALDRRALKTQILIYRALQEDDAAGQHRLHTPSSRL